MSPVTVVHHHHYYGCDGGYAVPPELASRADIAALEASIMTALAEATQALRTAVDALVGRITDFPAQVAELQATLRAERAIADALFAAEAAEDVAQDAALAEARALVDAAILDAAAAADAIAADTARVNTLAVSAPVEPVEPTA